MNFTPNTEVRLLSGVPLNSKYEHQLKFSDKTEQANYFTSKQERTFHQFTYVREDGTIKVEASRDSLYNCNYLMFRNENFTGKWFYAFIRKLEYINPNTTRIIYELDVWQTWQFDIDFKTSFVEREHRPRWNPDGTPVINTVDEGLDYGQAYETVSVEQVRPHDDLLFFVAVSKETNHYNQGTEYKKITPMINATPQPLSYYIHPFRLDGTSPSVTIGGTTYSNMSDIKTALEGFSTNEGMVNNIVSMYVTDYIGLNVIYDGSTLSLSSTRFETALISDNANLNVNTIYVKEIKSYESMTKTLGEKYEGFTEVEESKLLMYPYAVTVLDDFKGNRVEVKNEYIYDKYLDITVQGSLGTSNKTSYTLDNYNISMYIPSNERVVTSLENGLICNDPQDVPVISDYLSAFLQGNRNSLQVQKQQVAWSAVNGVAGALFGGVVGGVAGLASTTGSAYLQIKGMNAKIKDIDNQPPQMSKQGSNSSFDFGNDYTGIRVIKKEIKEEYRKKLTDFFKMFGYKVNEVKQPDLKTRQAYNYIKTVGANITGNIPVEDLEQIIAMFDNGVTLWHNTDVGNYDLVNDEV